MSGETSRTAPEKISIYFHIPFCRKKCDYCHFYVIPDREPFKSDYMEGLRLDWNRSMGDLRGKEVCSLYFGGGTPYLLGPERISEIIEWVTSLGSYSDGMEVTLEANPEEMSLDVMRQYAASGINRVSIGVQSLDDALLAALSRQHNSSHAKEAVLLCREAGIENISIDLMYDIPHQTLKQWEQTLDDALRLPITHLSLYNLVFEPHTVFYKKKSTLQPFLPDAEISSEMYRTAVAKTIEAGLVQYEISAFEKPGFRSRHNIGYWQGRPFLGFGPSAFSYWSGKRYRNVANLSRYLKMLKAGDSPVDYQEELKGVCKLRELLAVNLRMLEGVDLNDLQNLNGKLDEETESTLRILEKQGLLHFQGERVRLTQRGILFYDTVASEII